MNRLRTKCAPLTLLCTLLPGMAMADGLNPGHPTRDQLASKAQVLPVEAAPNATTTTLKQQLHSHKPTDKLANRQPDSGAARQPAQQQLTTAAGACSAAEIAPLTGTALTDALLAADLSCVNAFFNAGTDYAQALFNEADMVSVSNRLAQMAPAYTGVDDGHLLNLITYLRAGYFVQWGLVDEVGTYGAALDSASLAALQQFFANPHAFDISSANGDVLSEAVILIDSAHQISHFLDVAEHLLQQFDSSYLNYGSMRSATNAAYGLLYKGQWDSNYVTTLEARLSLLDTLDNFIKDNTFLIDSGNDYLINNAAYELGRMLMYPGAIKDKAKPMVQSILQRYSMSGQGRGIWLAAAEMADYYDNCADYGVCGYQDQLQAQILSIHYTCSPTLKIRAQAMSTVELADSCGQLSAQETDFHQKLATAGVPVADDLNTDLEVVVFDDYSNYSKYAGVFFGIGTNNGGMYLEGNPADPDNQARFIAHEASWLPEFEVWNLRHEYVHYLDGRFDMHGGFSEAMMYGSAHEESTVWWVEGLAEYISQGDDNQKAIDIGRANNYALSTLFGNNYSSGTDRVYRGGYLAVRYMFERHRNDVDTMLGFFRAGNYDAYANLMTAIGSSYDADFAQWLADVTTGISDRDGDGVADGDDAFPDDATEWLDTDHDGIGNNADTDDDNDGVLDSDDLDPLDPNVGGAGSCNTAACDPNVATMTAGIAKQGISSTYAAYFSIWVPAGTSTLRFTGAGGTGNADLYVAAGRYPSRSDYDARSTQSGNNETVFINAPATGGYYYVSLFTDSGFADMTLLAEFDVSQSGGSIPADAADPAQQTLYNGIAKAGIASDSARYYSIWVPAGATNLNIAISGGTGDADLYVRFGDWPTESVWDARPYVGGNNETVTLAAPQTGGYYYIMLKAFQPFSDVTLLATHD
ncbi:M9 family metallopeptidase [Shewanella cyperi]|uniref:M9 family metallopeptidase n=1 Tax=Shewanella cyperi TaxID=2814292 RepID=UPI001A9434AE|nr:M9 family metallopeptidase [Shewanella cyperi]QSX41897.1 collagenase [Shewanella cyperi]